MLSLCAEGTQRLTHPHPDVSDPASTQTHPPVSILCAWRPISETNKTTNRPFIKNGGRHEQPEM